ncbi:MAG: hypothetical protein NTY68_00045 [Candidatus Micrarchaeota archaeon]|nr:hypothetical protein [Candidatus Micrarchaeota archaeon]
MNAKYMLAIVIAMGISFSFSSLNDNLAKPWNQSSWSSYDFSFLGKTALNPDYTDVTIKELLENELNKSSMDNEALGLANSYENDLGDTIIARAECGTFFSFDKGNNMDTGTFILGDIRKWLLDGKNKEQDAYFLYSNPDSAKVIGIEGEKYSVEVDNDTETHYRIGDVSDAKASLSPNDLVAFGKIVDYFNAEHYFNRPVNRGIDMLALSNQWGALAYVTIYIENRSVSYGESQASCYDYEKDYRKTLDDLVSLYRYSAGNANGNASELNDIYTRLEFMGLCNENYTGVGSQFCRQTQKEVERIEMNTTSSYALAMKKDYRLSRDIYLDPPNVSSAIGGINYIWIFVNENNERRNQCNETLELFNSVVGEEDLEAARNNAILKKRIEEMGKQDIDKITEIYIPNGVVYSSIEDIRSSYQKFNDENIGIDEEITYLEGIRKGEKENWGSTVYDGYAALNKRIIDTTATVNMTLEYANQTTYYIRGKAKEMADSKAKEGFNVSSAYDNISQGDIQPTLGTKFEKYREAYIYMLGIANPPANSNDSAQFSLEVSKTQEMIDKANEDGIDVSSEQDLFNICRSSNNMRLAIEQMKGIRDSIEKKAEKTYSDLGPRRANIFRYLDSDVEYFSSIRSDVEAAEQGVVFNGKIDYINGLGKLNALRSVYTTAEKELVQKAKEYVLSSLVPKIEYSVPTPEINEESYLAGMIEIENPMNIEGTDIKVSFEPIIDLDPSDIQGVSSTKSGKTITLRVSRIGPLETKTIEFGKKGIFAKGSLEKSQSRGYNERATIIENWMIEIGIPISGFYMNQGYDEIRMDGKTYSGSKVARSLEKGTYELEATRTVENAYSLSEKQDVSSNSSSTRIMRKISIAPKVSLNEISIRKDNECLVKSSSFEYSDDGSSIVLKKAIASQDGYLELQCDYPKDSVSRRLVEIIGELNNTEMNSSEKSALDSISNLINIDNSTALSKLMILKDSIDKRQSDEASKNSTYGKLASGMKNEMDMINGALKTSSSLDFDSDLVESYLARKDSIIELQSSLDGKDLGGKIDALKSYDGSWTGKETDKWLASAFSNYTKLEKLYNDNGFDDSGIADAMSKFKENYRKAKASEGNLSYAVLASFYLNQISDKIGKKIENKSSDIEALTQEFKSYVASLESSISDYEKIYNDAKQSKTDSYLPITPASLRSQLDKMKKGFSEKQINYYRNETEKMASQISNEISGFSDIAYSELSSAKLLFEQSRGNLDQETIDRISKEIGNAGNDIQLRNYGSAIQESKSIISSLDSVLKQKGEGDTKILAIAVLVLGSLVIILLNYKDAIISKFGMKKEKSIFRKLKKGSEL